MTNNTAERAVKPFVVQIKVFQTSGSYAGARYTGKIFSIIQTCLINNVNVEKYLNYLLNNLNRKPIEELLPYSKEIRKMKWWVELSLAEIGGTLIDEWNYHNKKWQINLKKEWRTSKKLLIFILFLYTGVNFWRIQFSISKLHQK